MSLLRADEKGPGDAHLPATPGSQGQPTQKADALGKARGVGPGGQLPRSVAVRLESQRSVLSQEDGYLWALPLGTLRPAGHRRRRTPWGAHPTHVCAGPGLGSQGQSLRRASEGLGKCVQEEIWTEERSRPRERGEDKLSSRRAGAELAACTAPRCGHLTNF